MVDKIRAAVGGSCPGAGSVLGLTFKAGTRDLRDGGAALRAERAELTAYDPAPARGARHDRRGQVVASRARQGRGCIVLLTEWPEFRALDWAAIAGTLTGRVVVDARNLARPDVMRRAGIGWVGVGHR